MTPSTAIDSVLDADLADLIAEKADALYRAAHECCRQRQRYSRLVARSTVESELRSAQKMLKLCDAHLLDMADRYQRAAAHDTAHGGDEWWHKANGLWHATREYLRRHDCCDRSSQRMNVHSRRTLGDLTMQYDLEASALLALQQALAAYVKARPEADFAR